METQQNSKSGFSLGFFFLSLGVLISLITSVVSFLNLVFGTLDKKFPDALNGTYTYGYDSYSYDSIRMALATLIIFFPLCMVISYFWKKFMKGGIGQVDTVVRKWLIYIILFLSALVTAIDLVTLVRYFVSGEITTRFILKVVSVLAVALIVGIYYILELQNKDRVLGFKVGLWSAIKSAVLVMALIVWSFSVIGSPMQQRSWRLDDRRVQDLQNIQGQVVNYWQQKEKLPATLSDLVNPLSYSVLPVDPEFEKGTVYEYNIKNEKDLSFEVCATFAAPIPKGWHENQNYGYGGAVPVAYPMADNTSVSSMPVRGGGINESWEHQAGHTCFTRTIDKDLNPPYPKPLKQ